MYGLIRDYLRVNPMTSLAFIVFIALLYLKAKQKLDALQLYYHPKSGLVKKVVETSRLGQMVFKPSILLPNGNLQTFMNPVMGYMLKRKREIRYERELFKMKDGGTIAIDWVDEIPHPGLKSKKPIVAIMPGLSSDNDVVYVLNLLISAKQAGLRPVVINYRGASKVELTNATLYCAGSVNDLRQPLEYIHAKYCGGHGDGSGEIARGEVIDLFLVGNSMGANIVANYLGEEGAKCFVKAAVCVQPPMKMWECGENIEKRLFGFYNYILGRSLKDKMERWAPNIREAYLANHGIDLQ